MTLPNLITMGRLLLVPFIIWLILAGREHEAFWVFVIAGVSDAVDGLLARHFNLRSDLGAYLDPIADKALLMSIYVTLAIISEVPVWVTILIVSRDVLIVGGVVLAWMMSQPTEMQPRQISKLNTTIQITFAAVVLGDLAFGLQIATIRLILMYSVGVVTVLSGAVYLVDWTRHMALAPSATTSTMRPRERRKGGGAGSGDKT